MLKKEFWAQTDVGDYRYITWRSPDNGFLYNRWGYIMHDKNWEEFGVFLTPNPEYNPRDITTIVFFVNMLGVI